MGIESERKREQEVQVQKFLDLGRAVRNFISQYGSSELQRYSRIGFFADSQPQEAIAHIREGINIPPELSYEAQLANVKTYLEQMFRRSFSVEEYRDKN